MIKLIFTLSFLFTTSSFALVDMNSREYTKEWFDLHDFESSREYRAGTTGAFGKNWCSILDTQGTCSYVNNKETLWAFSVTKGRVTQVTSKKDKKSYSIHYNDQGLVSEIKSNGTSLALFSYDKNNQLTLVINEWESKYTYQYNINGYLVKTTWPDKTFTKISYNAKNEVINFLDRDNCQEKYTYTGDKKSYHKSTSSKVCDSESLAINTYEFWTVTKNNKSDLKRLKTTVSGVVRDITYHENGKPTSIIQNGTSATYEYDAQDKLTKKTTSYEVMEYTYNKQNKVSSVKQTKFDHKRNATTVTINFTYKKDLVVKATNSKGQSIRLTYDKNERIATVTDENNKTVSITYDDVFGKPSVVSVTGDDAIEITYKDNGQINKVRKPAGSTADADLTQVLEMVSPATQDIY